MGAYGGLGYLISEKAKIILENFNLPKHKFYQLPILEFKENSYQYYYMQILSSPFEYSMIDFEKSTFIKTDFFKENPKEVKFKNEIELTNAYKYLNDLEEKILPNHIIIKDNFSKKMDMFELDNLYFPFIINSKIQKAFIENNITGAVMDKVNITLE